LEEVNGCYVTPILHVGKLRHRAAMWLPHSKPKTGPGEAASFLHLLRYKAMVEKANKPGRSAVATGNVSNRFKQIFLLAAASPVL